MLQETAGDGLRLAQGPRVTGVGLGLAEFQLFKGRPTREVTSAVRDSARHLIFVEELWVLRARRSGVSPSLTTPPWRLHLNSTTTLSLAEFQPFKGRPTREVTSVLRGSYPQSLYLFTNKLGPPQ